MGFDVLTTNTSPLDPVRMLITHTLLVFYTPRHPPNYPADDSIWKAQNKCIPARKVKKDKLQMNQNSNSQGNLVVHSFAIFFQKKSDVCPVRIQPSLKKTFKLCGVITMAYFSQCYSTSIPPPPPPPPPARTVSLRWFATRTPTVFLHPNAKRPFTDSSPFFKFFGHGGPVSSTPLEIPS